MEFLALPVVCGLVGFLFLLFGLRTHDHLFAMVWYGLSGTMLVLVVAWLWIAAGTSA